MVFYLLTFRRCSRELPKCGNCRPWPGSCEYSRDRSSSPPSLKRSPEKDKSIVDRLQRLEETVQSLSNSVERALRTIGQVSHGKDNPEKPTAPNSTVPKESTRTDSGLFIAPSHSFSFLKDTSATMEANLQSSNDASHQSAFSGLEYLSTRLTTAQVDQQPTENMTTFYVPSRALGYRSMSQILEFAELGQPFFRLPPEDMIKKIIFEPHKFQEKAWIVYVNYLLLSNTSGKDDEDDEKEKFRWNVQLALNNSSIFLEPREANVQMLILLAMHGEDYAAPNLSWMLLGHACRQAEALGFHVPAPQFSEAHQEQRLCLFWLLFMIDKSCALAFGRPAFLPTMIYRDVPLPADHSLLKFHPHEGVLKQSDAHSRVSHFGAQFLKTSFELAKLMGAVLDALAKGTSSPTKEDIRSQLDTWYLDTERVLTETMNSEIMSATAENAREMGLGINSLKFQYLHIRILLLKGDESNSNLCLTSSREAIAILPSMVSNWSSVYNGVVWYVQQLLYFPFTPFFVIFENIIHHQGSLTPDIKRDLNLLATAMKYFADMRSLMRLLATVCSRLQHVAAAFLKLARVHVSHNVPNDSARARPPPKFDEELTTDNPAHGYIEPLESPTAMDVGELDLANYLEWLPADIDRDVTWPLLHPEGQNPPPARPASGGGRQMFDTTFDWFSWDAYYAGTQN
ncbi:hypothetical protein BO71DRAFT_312305 [Aspergillus ellipticus CBS 707.79]|uniref:Xylanolytic transcriptional activator regulatory domain-containing protein n=1 Tax=Aspergillus ellipticus CBS 707.79 TaxID=1448320 RepID=A0A319DR87_9EURO|nr:hypothetical protein BO71DRAFT_312305 [Aspergillus ellipticus CBS 707.79]